MSRRQDLLREINSRLGGLETYQLDQVMGFVCALGSVNPDNRSNNPKSRKGRKGSKSPQRGKAQKKNNNSSSRNSNDNDKPKRAGQSSKNSGQAAKATKQEEKGSKSSNPSATGSKSSSKSKHQEEKVKKDKVLLSTIAKWGVDDADWETHKDDIIRAMFGDVTEEPSSYRAIAGQAAGALEDPSTLVAYRESGRHKKKTGSSKSARTEEKKEDTVPQLDSSIPAASFNDGRLASTIVGEVAIFIGPQGAKGDAWTNGRITGPEGKQVPPYVREEDRGNKGQGTFFITLRSPEGDVLEGSFPKTFKTWDESLKRRIKSTLKKDETGNTKKAVSSLTVLRTVIKKITDTYGLGMNTAVPIGVYQAIRMSKTARQCIWARANSIWGLKDSGSGDAAQTGNQGHNDSDF